MPRVSTARHNTALAPQQMITAYGRTLAARLATMYGNASAVIQRHDSTLDEIREVIEKGYFKFHKHSTQEDFRVLWRKVHRLLHLQDPSHLETGNFKHHRPRRAG